MGLRAEDGSVSAGSVVANPGVARDSTRFRRVPEKKEKNMDRKTIFAIGLSLLFFVGWQKYYIEPRMVKPHSTPSSGAQMSAPTTAGAPAASAVVGSGAVATPVPATNVVAKSTEIVTGTGRAMIGDAGKFFTGWNLTEYRRESKKDAPPVDLFTVTQNPAGEGELAFDSPELAYANNVQGTMRASEGGAIWTYEDANLKLTREYTYGPNLNYVDLVIAAEFKTKKPGFAFISIDSKGPAEDPEEADRQLLQYTDTTLERFALNDVEPTQQLPGVTKWIGTQNRYFLFSIVPGMPASSALAQKLAEKHSKISLVYPVQGNAIRIPMKVYFGPKEMNVLRSVEPSLDLTIDFGWFTFFAYPILKVMKWIHGEVGNWGWAIVLLTLLIKILTFPLTYKSMKSMKKIAVLQPQMNALREKYKDDKEALNREMITFMRTQGYNPVSGCLPILVQMPVFFALYRVLYSSIELYHAPFFGWITDLSLKDPLYITPVLLTGLMWLQQKITPSTATDPMQAKMLQWMPLFFGLLMVNLPAGLTVYMLVNAAASIVQQQYLNKKFATPTVTTAATVTT